MAVASVDDGIHDLNVLLLVRVALGLRVRTSGHTADSQECRLRCVARS